MNKKQVIIVALVIIALIFSGLAFAVNTGVLDIKYFNGASNSKSPTGGVLLYIEPDSQVANNP